MPSYETNRRRHDYIVQTKYKYIIIIEYVVTILPEIAFNQRANFYTYIYIHPKSRMRHDGITRNGV